MKNNLFAAAVALTFGFASSAFAQATTVDDDATIRLTGQATSMVSIKLLDSTPTFDFTTALSTVSATSDSAIPSDRFAFELRSNVKYALTASVVDNVAGASDVAPGDINYEFESPTGSGMLMNKTDGVRTDAISDTKKTGTLADLGAGLLIVDGARISNKGGFTDDNALTGAVSFSLLPQFFDPAAKFDYSVVLTIASN